MRVVVLGASGGCGKHMVSEARRRGHDVVAVGRASSSIDAVEGVEVRRGELTDVAFLTEAFTGADAVLSGLGPRIRGLAPWNKPEIPGFPEKSARAVVEAAKAAGVKRIVVVSAGGAGDSYEAMPGFFRTMIKTTALKHAYRELGAMEQVYLSSGLDVVIARPTGLTDEPATGQAVVVKAFAGRPSIPRADVALWMLDQLEGEPTEIAPMITVTGAA